MASGSPGSRDNSGNVYCSSGVAEGGGGVAAFADGPGLDVLGGDV